VPGVGGNVQGERGKKAKGRKRPGSQQKRRIKNKIPKQQAKRWGTWEEKPLPVRPKRLIGNQRKKKKKKNRRKVTGKTPPMWCRAEEDGSTERGKNNIWYFVTGGRGGTAAKLGAGGVWAGSQEVGGGKKHHKREKRGAKTKRPGPFVTSGFISGPRSLRRKLP